MSQVSYVTRATKGGLTVVTKLYGEVTPERIAAETAMTAHRADQLDPAAIAELRASAQRRVAKRDDDDDSWDEEDGADPFDGPFQSTGR